MLKLLGTCSFNQKLKSSGVLMISPNEWERIKYLVSVGLTDTRACVETEHYSRDDLSLLSCKLRSTKSTLRLVYRDHLRAFQGVFGTATVAGVRKRHPCVRRLGAKEMNRLAVLPLTSDDWVNFVNPLGGIGGQNEIDTMSFQIALQFNGIDLTYYSNSNKLRIHVRYTKCSGDDLRLGDIMRWKAKTTNILLTSHNDVKVGDFFEQHQKIYKVKYLRGGHCWCCHIEGQTGGDIILEISEVVQCVKEYLK